MRFAGHGLFPAPKSRGFPQTTRSEGCHIRTFIRAIHAPARGATYHENVKVGAALRAATRLNQKVAAQGDSGHPRPSTSETVKIRNDEISRWLEVYEILEASV